MRTPYLLSLSVALVLSGCGVMPTADPAPTLVSTLAPPTTPILVTPATAPTATLGPEAEATAFAQAVLAAKPALVESSPAPDGIAAAELWSATCHIAAGFDAYGPVGYDEIRYRATPEGEPVVAARQIRVCQGLGAFGLRVLQWSPDGRYVFFTDAAQGSPDGGGCPWFGTVRRWSVDDQSTTTLGNGATSPDGDFVAGIAEGHVIVWSWSDTAVVRAAVIEPNWPVSAIGWAPSGDRVLFVQSEAACTVGGSSVIGMLTVSDVAVVELLRTREPTLLTFRFESLDELTFYGTSPDAHRFRLVGESLVAIP